MTGLAVVLGNDRNCNEVFMQAPGQGRCLRADDLRKAIDKSVTLHRSMLRYAQMSSRTCKIMNAVRRRPGVGVNHGAMQVPRTPLPDRYRRLY
jgi:hypothetical protein